MKAAWAAPKAAVLQHRDPRQPPGIAMARFARFGRRRSSGIAPHVVLPVLLPALLVSTAVVVTTFVRLQAQGNESERESATDEADAEAEIGRAHV